MLLFSGGVLDANNSQFDMLDDIFALDLEALQNISIASVSKMDQPLKDAPANMLVFTEEQIEKRGFRCVSDLLETLPGVTIHNFSTSGYFNSINVRGVTGAHYFKILLDGIEIDQSNGEQITTAMNFPLGGIARVEVLYGPASVIYGADAVSAVINLVTQEQSGKEIFFSTGAEGYNYGYLRYARSFGDYKLVVRASLHQDQEYQLDERYPNHFPQKDIINGSGEIVQPAAYRVFDYKPSNTASLNMLVKHSDFDVGFNYSRTEDSTLLGQVDKKSYQNLFDPDSNIQVSIYGIYGKYHASYNNILLTSTLSYDQTTVDEGSYFINANTDYNKAYKYSKSERYAFEEIAQHQLAGHQIVFGASFEHFNSMPMSFDLPSPKPSDAYNYPGSDIPINYYKTSWDNIAVFGQDYFTYSDQLKFSLALRYDYNTLEGHIVNPRVAAIYQPSSKVTHKLIYSEAYLSPSMNDKYKHYGLAFEANDIPGDTNAYKVSYFRAPNKDLEAEKERSIEYAVFTQLPSNLFIQGSLYYTYLNNLIGEQEITNVSDAIDDLTVLNATQIYNSGHGTITGADIALNYTHLLGNINTQYWFNYSYIDGHMKHDKNLELPFIAPHQINTGVILDWEQWSFSPSLKWVSRLNSGYVSDDSTQRNHIDGYALLNAYGIYRFNANISASLRMSNILDTKYYNARNGFSSTYQVPQLGRTFILGLKATF
jgi:outer membrane receptor protein involved in Fe transport